MIDMQRGRLIMETLSYCLKPDGSGEIFESLNTEEDAVTEAESFLKSF